MGFQLICPDTDSPKISKANSALFLIVHVSLRDADINESFRNYLLMSMLKKIFIGSVMMMTVLSMSIVVAPEAKAAAAAGDLIKTSTSSSVYYLGTNMKKYVFPNAATYFSWYKDFSGVVTIPQSEMDSYGLPVGNVTVRPGTNLVKSPSVNTVYAVEPNGTLRSIVSEANAIALWGADWAKKVLDIPDSFIVNYIPGTALPLGQYPVGQLIKTSGSSDVMLIAADGTARKFATEAAFNANSYNFAYVATVPSTYTMPATGAVVSGSETGLANVAQSGVTVGPVVTGSGVSVALSSDTPASMSIPNNVSKIELAKFNVTAANDGAAVLNSIKITRTGLGGNGDFPLIWIEKNGVRLTAQKSINSADESILTFAPALSIPAGQTVILSVFGSVSNAPGAADALTIKAAADVDASGASVSGSFPISGNSMTFTTSYVISSATFAAVGGAATLNVGDEDAVVGSFSVTAGTRDQILKSITLKSTGNADLAQVLSDIRLEKNGVKISESTTLSGTKDVTFVLANGGLVIEKTDAITFKVVADIIDKDASNNTIQFKLNKAGDMSINEVNTGFSATVIGAAVALGLTTLTAGDVTISKSASSPAASSATKSTKAITALIAKVKANQAFTADGMVLTLATPTTTVAKFENIKLYVNNVLVDSLSADTGTGVLGDYITYDSAVTIKQGDNEIKVILDVMSTAVDADSITVKLDSANAFTAPVYANDETVTPSGSATAGAITVAVAGITASRSDGFSTDKLIVKGTEGAVLGKFTIKAQNDDIKITTVALSSNTGDSTVVSDANLSDFQIYVDGTSLSTKDFAGGATFGGLNITIAKDTTKVIELRGSISTSAEADQYFKTTLTFSGEDSKGKVITDKTASSVQVKVADSGTLTIAKDGDSPAPAIMAAATTGNSIAKWKLTATNDDISLKKVYISNLKGTSSDARISNIDLYNGTTKVGSATPDNGEVYFNLNSTVTITKGSSIVLEAKADFNQIEESASTNKDIQLAVTAVTANSSSGTELPGANNAIVAFAASGRHIESTVATNDTTLNVSNISGIATGTVILIGTEQMLVVATPTASTTVVSRGINGTARAGHAALDAITKVTAISTDSFRVRKTYPIITLDTLPSTILTAGDNVVSKIKISAQANEAVTVSSIILSANATVANVLVASSSASNSVRINGSIYSAATVAPDDDNNTGKAMSQILVTFSTPITVAKGTSKTIEVVVNVTSLSSVNNNLTTKIVSDASYTSAINTLVWSDNADPLTPSATNAGSYKVLGIPTVSQVLSQN